MSPELAQRIQQSISGSVIQNENGRLENTHAELLDAIADFGTSHFLTVVNKLLEAYESGGLSTTAAEQAKNAHDLLNQPEVLDFLAENNDLNEMLFDKAMSLIMEARPARVITNVVQTVEGELYLCFSFVFQKITKPILVTIKDYTYHIQPSDIQGHDELLLPLDLPADTPAIEAKINFGDEETITFQANATNEQAWKVMEAKNLRSFPSVNH